MFFPTRISQPHYLRIRKQIISQRRDASNDEHRLWQGVPLPKRAAKQPHSRVFAPSLIEHNGSTRSSQNPCRRQECQEATFTSQGSKAVVRDDR